MPWAGDKEITIDRFDVRAHLDSIPESQPTSRDEANAEEQALEEVEDPSLNYERYRILIQNELAGSNIHSIPFFLSSSHFISHVFSVFQNS